MAEPDDNNTALTEKPMRQIAPHTQPRLSVHATSRSIFPSLSIEFRPYALKFHLPMLELT